MNHFAVFINLFNEKEEKHRHIETQRTSMSNSQAFIAVPARKAFDVNLSTPIRNFIKATFGDKEDYSASIEGLNALRAETLLRSQSRDDFSRLLR